MRTPLLPSTKHTVTFRAACGHDRTETFHSRLVDRAAHVAQQAASLASSPCAACRDAERIARATGASWQREGYASAESYEAALQFEARREQGERDLEAFLARVAALPASERPFRTSILDGCGTLDDLAREHGED